MSHAFQYTTIKMIIFCACKNLLNNKKAIDKWGHIAPPPPSFSRSTTPFLRFPFLEIQDVPTFHRSTRKTKHKTIE